jgi:hypothetical protein
VDGVLNAVTSRPDPGVWPDWRRGTATADGVEWPIWFSPTVTETVARLHRAALVEVRWLTTWGEQANGELRRLLDVPAFDVVSSPPVAAPPAVVIQDLRENGSGEGGGTAPLSHARVAGGVESDPTGASWWKLRAAQRVVDAEPDRPIIWTDDDLNARPAAVAWAEQDIPDRLLLSPRSAVGLTPRQLRAIRRYCGDE